MAHGKLYSPRMFDTARGMYFRCAASGLIPPGRFRASLPAERDRAPGPAFPSLDIVTHCWQYAHLLVYQLSSFVRYPPTKLRVRVTVFYAEEDRDTVQLLNAFDPYAPPRVTWNWQRLPKAQLFRRSIGRNRAALSSEADWVWMTDCDIVFHRGCLDSLADVLRGRREPLVFPRHVRTTRLLEDSAPLLRKGRALHPVDIDTTEFSLHDRDRAKGPFQIVHGDVARAIGYCDRIRLYQTPADHWCKCYEDRAFRWLVGTQGTPVEIVNAYQIRHVSKGRYQANSRWSRFRSMLRRMQDRAP